MTDTKPAMPSPLNREEALFQAAVQLAGADRAVFLNGVCLGDAALRQRLEDLLAAHDAPDELSPPDEPAPVATMKLELADAPDEAIGQTLGAYKLREKIGEGGCGVVYVADQEHPVRRRVALKVIKLGMDTKQVVARFESERQALAMMDHPNIAKVLDAGTTETGRPYFVMELVRGIRITEYCDKNNLNTKERIDLFISVCHAIQHAHQKGIIHRDIKPSNILVTLHDGVPVPKVIDFGIAKATEGRLTDNTIYTQLHQFIGTPAYMSPEQAEMSGLDVDTRSDIYSLGVLLYELLAGSTPFDGKELMSQGIDQMRKTIRETEPPRPSTRFATLEGEELTTTAKRRSADKSKLVHQLKGDIDWIVMKCLEKDRTRRYDTANGLAADLNRHLNNEPVVARPPSAAYKFQKAFRRNKLAFTAGTAIAAALVVGISLSVWQAVRATHATREAVSARQEAEASEAKAVAAQANEAKLREQAEQSRAREAELRAKAEANAKSAKDEANKSKQVSLFMEDMLKGAGPAAALGRDTTLLREIMDKATARADTALKDQPEALAQLLSKIANTYGSLGDYKKYDALTREVYQLRRGLNKGDDPDIAAALLNMGSLGTNYVAREALTREALAMYQRLNGSNNLYVANANERLAANLAYRQDRYAEAEPVIRGAIAMRTELVGETNKEVAGDYDTLANDLWSLTRTNEALQAVRRSIQLNQASEGSINPGLIWPQLDYGWMLLHTGDLKTAESLFREGIVISEKYFASVNREARYKREGAFDGLEQVLVAQGRSSETNAVELERQQFLARTAAIAPVEIAGDTNAPDMAPTSVAVISPDDLAQQGRFTEAVSGFVQLTVKEPNHSKPYLQLAALLLETGDLNGYRQLSHRALNLFQGKTGTTVVRISKLGLLAPLTNHTDTAQAAQMADQALAETTDAKLIIEAQIGKGLAEYRLGHFAGAIERMQKVAAIPTAGSHTDSLFNADAVAIIACAQQQLQQADQARASLAQAKNALRAGRSDSASALGANWQDTLIAQALVREASQLIAGTATTK
jgi:serine/threonine protein kinase